jgi:transposase
LRIAHLPRNSSNSSRPPSTDLYKPVRNTNNSLRKKTGRKTGGQPGHAGSTLLFNMSVPDAIISHSASFCESCGNDLSLCDSEQEDVRQVVDIPDPRCTITNHITYKKVCTCGYCNHGSFPANVKSYISYGPAVEALVVNLSTRQYIPLARLATLIGDQYGIIMSQGTVANILERFELKAQSVYDYIQAAIPKAEVAGSDETSIKVNGNRNWFHTYQTTDFTFIGFHPSRGKVAQEEFYPLGLPNTDLVTDCLAMQLATPARTHQLCVPHLLRELTAMKQEHPNQHWSEQMIIVLELALELKKVDYTIEQLKQIEQKFQDLLQIDQSSAPGKISAFWKRMIKHSDKVFTFLYHPNVPPDNNGSERAIRNVKVKQKVSGHFKTEQGANRYAKFRSVIDTLNKQGKDIHAALLRIANLVPE